MPLFELKNKKLEKLASTEFKLEKDLQDLLEKNLEEVFNIRFVATEFSTGNIHSGRIDTLGLSEDNNPVIIEYKKVQSSQLINQSLFYLSWINDHKGDFEIAVQNALGHGVEVDWSNIRVICIAPNYRKYDLHAVNMMGANIELWQYKVYEGRILQLEEINQSDGAGSTKELSPGKKAAITRANSTYTVEEHCKGKSEIMLEMFNSIREFIVDLDESVDENPKKNYIAYKTTQNFACVEIHNKHLLVYLKLDYKELDTPPRNTRDMTGKGHYGTGDFEIRIENPEQVEGAKKFIELSYKKVGA